MSVQEKYSTGQPSLRYVDYGGAGLTLLLLHGVTRCERDWESLIPSLTASWRVIALDQRGHGGSERADSYLVTDYVADAVRWLRDDVAEPVFLFGHSLGAMVATGVAPELPQFVRGIVLEDPPFHTMGNRISGSAWQAQFIGMKQAALRGGNTANIIDALADIRIPTSNGGYKRLGEIRERSSLACSAEYLLQLDPEVLTPVIAGRWLDGWDVANTLSNIRCPVLLLQGDPIAGGALSDADANAAVTALLSCQHVRFSNAGHRLHSDRPKEVLQALSNFVPVSNL